VWSFSNCARPLNDAKGFLSIEEHAHSALSQIRSHQACQ
jgi:hypothetical protein